MKSKTLYIISGVPGSGKDYFLNQYFGNSSNVKIISRDVIRFSLIENDDEYFSKESLVFSKFCKAIREAFNEYDIVIANATHLNERSRNKLLNSLGKDFLKDKLINCIECKNDEDVYEFKENFEKGVYENEVENSLHYLGSSR